MIRRYSQYKSRGLTIDLPHVYPLGRVFKGQLFAMPMPSCDQLEQLMSALRADGIDSVVSLLEHAESKKLGLAEEQSACHAAEMQFRQFPIPDFGVPLPEELHRLITQLADDLKAGHRIVVHCRGGIGRTGLVCSCILVASGMDADSAMNLVKLKRGRCVPETEAQTNIIRQFAATHPKNAPR